MSDSPDWPLPDKETGCHRTGFTKTCFECVVTHKCRLWKPVVFKFDPKTGKPPEQKYDCLDSLQDAYFHSLIKIQEGTTESVNDLRNNVAQANDHAMVGTLARLNEKLDLVQEGQLEEIRRLVQSRTSQKLIEN